MRQSQERSEEKGVRVNILEEKGVRVNIFTENINSELTPVELTIRKGLVGWFIGQRRLVVQVRMIKKRQKNRSAILQFRRQQFRRNTLRYCALLILTRFQKNEDFVNWIPAPRFRGEKLRGNDGSKVERNA